MYLVHIHNLSSESIHSRTPMSPRCHCYAVEGPNGLLRDETAPCNFEHYCPSETDTEVGLQALQEPVMTDKSRQNKVQ